MYYRVIQNKQVVVYAVLCVVTSYPKDRKILALPRTVNKSTNTLHIISHHIISSSAATLSLPQAFPFGRSLITASISSLQIVYTSFSI